MQLFMLDSKKSLEKLTVKNYSNISCY